MKLPIVSGMEIIKILIKQGFVQKGREGSHVTLEKITSEGVFRTTVPLHKETGKGLFLDIIRQSGYTREEFIKLIKKS